MTAEKEENTTGKQKLFAEYYTGEANLVGTTAARMAGYDGDDNVLAVTASRLLRNAKVRKLIDKKFADVGMGANEAIVRLSEQARGSLGDLLDDKGAFNLRESKTKGTDRLLKELTVIRDNENRTITYKYKIHDSQAALDKIARIHSLYVEKHEHKIDFGKLSDAELEAIVRG